MNKSLVLALVAAGALASIADMALASTTGTGIAAGFGTLNTALDSLIKGAGGYLDPRSKRPAVPRRSAPIG